MRDLVVLRVVAKLLIPYILLYGFYVQWHGDFGPGGGFQAGVILAAGIVLYALVFGLRATEQVLRPSVVRERSFHFASRSRDGCMLGTHRNCSIGTNSAPCI